MESFRKFIRDFFKNNGQYVFFSLLIAKICAFLGSLLIIRILPQSEFGLISIVASVFAIFSPFNGFGSTQSLLRFGSISDNKEDKDQLARYLFMKGFVNQLFLSLGFLLVSLFYINKYEGIFLIFACFAIRLVGLFFLAHIQSELRINRNNKEFAKVGNVVNIGTLLLILPGAYFGGLLGYLLAITLAPFLALFWMKKIKPESTSILQKYSPKEIWDYALHSAETASLSDALFSMDILLLGFLLNETAVAQYKVAILIPANITFLALTLMQSDFPVLANQYKNKIFLKNYIFNYYKLFVPICLVIFLPGFFWSKEILHWLFGSQYAESSLVFTILLGVFCLNMLFRNLYGNLLSAVGKMKFNTITSVLALLFIIILAWIFVPKYGILGMALATGGTLLFTGFLLMVYFQYYLKTLK